MAHKLTRSEDQSKGIGALEAQIEHLILEQKNLNKRASSLQRRNIRLQELNRIKDEFIAVASHQLRTPATGVKQYLGLLLEGYADKLTPNQKIFLEKADESNNRQLRIIDDLLQVARIDSESFKIRIAQLNVGQLLYEVIGDLKDKLKTKKQKIIFDPPKRKIYIRGDVDKLRMVLENLLDNAINYSMEKTVVEVKLKLAKDSVVIDIKDEGVGINRRDFPKLFQKFSRIPNPLSVEVGGTGLGLYWAERIIKLHHGSIMVRSKIDQGSTFTVLLPLKQK